MEIKRETLKIEHTETHSYKVGKQTKSYDIDHGTVDVVFKGETLTVKCHVINNDIYVHGFVGRYQTGAKTWPASIWFRPDVAEPHVYFGRDDRSGRFNKLNCIYYVG